MEATVLPPPTDAMNMPRSINQRRRRLSPDSQASDYCSFFRGGDADAHAQHCSFSFFILSSKVWLITTAAFVWYVFPSYYVCGPLEFRCTFDVSLHVSASLLSPEIITDAWDHPIAVFVGIHIKISMYYFGLIKNKLKKVWWATSNK